MSTQRSDSSIAVVAAILLFAAWEIIEHVLLMGMEMLTYHITAFIGETIIAIAVIFWVTRLQERVRIEGKRAERLATVVAEAMASEEGMSSPVASLIQSLQELRSSTEDMPVIQKQLERIEHDVHRIQVVNRGLKELLLPIV